MTLQIQTLNFNYKDLNPYISEQTMHFHYDKHYETYVKNTNNLALEYGFDKMLLPQIIELSSKDEKLIKLYQNAAQALNHEFYFQSLSPCQEPHGPFYTKILSSFSSLDSFWEKIINTGVNHFASGWLWVNLIDNEIQITTTSNADTYLNNKQVKTLFCIDLWEHAYYLDYQNKRIDFLKNSLKILNWDFVNKNFLG